jgi:uncharacterized protein (TIGR02996 family)
MSDRDALLAAILAQPDDDTPRLVYADWLDEHDEPERAEFIRIQFRLPNLSRRTVEAKRLAARETELRSKLFKHLTKLPFAEITFRRGFVASITSGLQVFAKHAAKLRPEDAPAYELILKPDAADDDLLEGDYEDDWRKEIGLFQVIAKRRELRRCVSLDPRTYLRGRTAEPILNSPNLTGLRRLRVTGDAGDAFEDLDSPTFSNLRWLDLHDNDDLDHHPPTITRLAHSRRLVNLEHLDLGDCNLDDECLRALATTPHLLRLRYLDISDARLRFREGFANFIRTSSMPALTELDLSDSFWWGRALLDPDEAVRQLADSPLIERLTKLALRRNEITDAGALALAASPLKLKLTHLDLWGNDISATAKRALEKRFGRGVCTYRQPAKT